MVFSEDAILLSFFSRYDGEEGDLKDAIIKYCSGGALEANRPGTIDPSKGEITDLDQVIYLLFLFLHIRITHRFNLIQATSPTDSAIDIKKKKRANQQAAAEKDKAN